MLRSRIPRIGAAGLELLHLQPSVNPDGKRTSVLFDVSFMTTGTDF